MQKTKIEEMDALTEGDRLLMEQRGKTVDITTYPISSLLLLKQAKKAIKTGRKKAKIRKKKTEKINFLFKTKQLLMTQQGKTVDRTSQYCHYYHCSMPRR